MLMLSFAPAIVSGFSDKAVAGPFTIVFTINASAQPTINVSGPVKQNGSNEYDLQLKAGPLRGRMINVTIDDYQNSTDVSEPRLISLITDRIKSNSYRINWNTLNIGSVPGIMAQIQDSQSLMSYSIAAYSPDGNGKQGNTIILIKSSLSEDVTDSFLRNFKVSRNI
jgi:hypothetical protein